MAKSYHATERHGKVPVARVVGRFAADQPAGKTGGGRPG